MTEQTEPPEILIAEDSPMEAELLRRSLARAGYRVTMTKNGEEGLQAARARRPALVVSDIRMPLMDGYQLCREIKYDDDLWNVPVILLTILSEPEDIMEAINSGADSYIVKPFIEATLLERIRALLATPIRRKRKEERRSEEVEYNGKRRTITGGSQQILNLLLSVYENTLSQNRELTRIQSQLNLLNESLDDQVRERTAKLVAEERELIRANTALRTLSACNVALVRARTEEELFQNVCRHIVETGGYQLAWGSYPGEGADSPPVPFAHFGNEIAYQRHDDLRLNPEHNRDCLTFSALRERRTQMCNNLHEMPECAFGPLCEAGVAAILALPLLHNNEIYGVLTVFSSVSEVFGAAEIKLMEELAGDLAYGIVTLRTRTQRDHYFSQLSQAMRNTVAAIARTLEKRDPYTAGHQQRVTALSVAIGREIGLDKNSLDGLYFGSTIHDIGKISVPAEILSKPGKLSGIEYRLIQAHTEAGFEIVQGIDFPWPVEKMIVQHHERMDGSGYPKGLKDDEIIIESRIIAVADVIEAMTSHRPYRPGLGIEAALAEIEQGSGSRYDPLVVEACLRLFREKGFAFASA